MDHDLVDIDDRDHLYRRIPAVYFKRDGTISSYTFKLKDKPDNHLSVDIAKLLTGPSDTLLQLEESRRPRFGVGSLVAYFPRSLGFSVRHDPLPGNPAHGLMEGENDEETCYALAEEIARTILIRPAV